MARQRLPELGQSLRFYVEDTLRTRVRSPGIERYRTSPRRGAAGVLAVVLALGVVAAALYGLFF